ncbi:MAG TPA: helix-turn-helix domain-containing protein [Sedimentisphaerales bacterium]|nr:helix-turn-helix domain-containing protein [Sedimentisphaerales bacterium]
MAGMFYSLQEAAEKLNKTEEELKQIVKEGKLREFRDGPNLLFKVEEVEALMSDTGVMPSEQALELEALESEALESEALSPEAPSPETPEFEAPAPEDLEEELLAPSEQAAGTSEILLAPETGAPVAPSELTDADTALTGEGISVLGETDSEYEVTDDTLAETAVPTGTTPEVPLEEIEGDVNLDSFGSGSGLLDLSLQADDTSLGGILDEIYMAEEEGQEPVPAEVGSGSAAAVAAEAEQMLAEEEPVAPQLAPDVQALARPSYIELAPDMQSNTLGMLLFLPLVVVLYTTVVAVAGLKGVTPSILAGIQGLIWIIMGGVAVVAVLVTGAAFMLGGGGETATKTKKPKRPKAPKAKKEKKPKEPKKPKKAK